MATVTVPRTGHQPLTFEGVLIGEFSTKSPTGPLESRWSEISVYRAGREVTLRFPATDRGSGVERYQLAIGRRGRVSVPTARAQGTDLVGLDAIHRVRLARGVHRVSVAAIDRAGNRGPTATRKVRVR